LSSNDKPPEHYALCVFGVNHKKYAGEAIIPNSTGAAKAAAVAIALQAWWWGLALLLASRLLDGLDGSVARLTQPTDAGGFLDIALDFVFYAAIPLAFAVAHPATNALPAAALLASFIGTGSSFLAFAALAKKTRADGHRLAGQKLLLLGRPDRSHRNHHRVCRHVHLA
jgi:phosphatidylglycerophosphate synthase